MKHFVLVCMLGCAGALAQPVQQITVTGRALAPLSIGGFADMPADKAPLAGNVIGEAQWRDAGVARLSDLTRSDASVTDAYDSEGYWSIVAIRGYTLDNRFNYRRDGLPIDAETAIALDNKAAIEILKGASGMQAGTSTPGGLVNFVVKRPERNLRSATLSWRESGTLGAAVDLAQRFGADDAFGLRVNAAGERLDPPLRDQRGHRRLLALAADARLGDTLVEAEVESSRQSQPSQPGFSLLGDLVPDAHAIDPRLNLNNQPWSLPVVFEGTTASLRLTQRLSPEWRAVAHAMTQRLATDDRIAFPFGCGAEGNFDRFCSDGSFDLYDYRSENERRRSDALDVSVAGRARFAGHEHAIAAGVLRTRFRDSLPDLAFNLAGTGTIDGSAVVASMPDPIPGTALERRGASTELYLRDAVTLGERFGAWLGLRHTRLDRGYRQAFTTPWLALSASVASDTLLYASWGEGVESLATPNLPGYANAGAPLPAQRSRQLELGAKGRTPYGMQWSAAAFDIRRPHAADTGSDFFIDGDQRHRGVEAQVEGRLGPWQWLANAMLLRARLPDGSRPPNVPARLGKAMLARDIASLPGLTLQGWLVAEGDRTALPQPSSPAIGGWARLDLAARYVQRAGDATLTWRVGVDNVADRRAWKESPFQFGHAWLYPLAPRTWRVSLQAEL